MALNRPDHIEIAIVGRPNVGKSTLFNRLFGRRRALVHDLPGVTRDRLYEKTNWVVRGKKIPVALIDTGGMGGDHFADEIQDQVNRALESAHVLLFVVDGAEGITPRDRELVRLLQQTGAIKRSKLVLGIVNKVDDHKHEDRVVDFFGLGDFDWIGISAEHNLGISVIEERVLECVEENFASLIIDAPRDEDGEIIEEETKADRMLSIAVVGRPNVGKSTLVNALIGDDRMITSPIAGTTVDSVDTEVRLGTTNYRLIDTAGLRRKSKTEQGVEVLSVVQTKKALDRCDLALLLVDAETGVTDQDEKIGGMIEDAGCSVLICVNKWDALDRKTRATPEKAAEDVRNKMKFLRYAPILLISALQRRGFEDLPSLIEEIFEKKRLKISTHELTEWVREACEIHNPNNAKFYLAHQSGRHPPTFVFHVSDPRKIHFSLSRHLVNSMRQRWGFMGSPVRLHFVQGKGKPGRLRPGKLKPGSRKF